MESGIYSVEEAKSILANPSGWSERITKDNEVRKEVKKLNETCLTCGEVIKKHEREWYLTSDGRALCSRCRDLCMTISPEEFKKEKDGYIKRHDADFFLQHMGQAVHPHQFLSVNFSGRCDTGAGGGCCRRSVGKGYPA